MSKLQCSQEGNYFLMKVDTGDAERHLRLVIDKYHRTIFWCIEFVIFAHSFLFLLFYSSHLRSALRVARRRHKEDFKKLRLNCSNY
jgi:hypothetical protein